MNDQTLGLNLEYAKIDNPTKPYFIGFIVIVHSCRECKMVIFDHFTLPNSQLFTIFRLFLIRLASYQFDFHNLQIHQIQRKALAFCADEYVARLLNE